jgi:6-phosphofructokinase 2
LEAAALDLVRSGAAAMIVVSMGSEGALLATATGTKRLAAPPIEVRSAVGAGDSFVAGMTLALARGRTPEDALAYGIATGTSAVAHVGTARPDPAQVEAIYADIMASTA